MDAGFCTADGYRPLAVHSTYAGLRKYFLLTSFRVSLVLDTAQFKGLQLITKVFPWMRNYKAGYNILFSKCDHILNGFPLLQMYGDTRVDLQCTSYNTSRT